MNRNIRSRLTTQFTLIVSFLLIAFSVSIYVFSASYMKTEFFTRLKDKATTTARLLIEVKEVDYDLLKIIDRNASALIDEKVIIYDFKNSQIYNSLDDYTIEYPEELLDRIRLEKEVRYTDGKNEVIGLLYTDRFNRFVVIASAHDKYGKSKLMNLKWILIIGFIISNLLAILFGRAYAGRALMPISNVLKQVEKITITSLNMRVNEGNGTDEIAQLAITFNKMLERLESAFEVQRSFVSNASHELRTPLTSIKGNIEVSLLKTRSTNEYQEILTSTLEDTQNLIELSNRLLDLAKANSDISEIAVQKTRVDELLWQTRSYVTERKKDFNVQISFDESVSQENKLTLLGNEHLLKTAIANLMDNGCKYSPDKSVNLLLSIENDLILIDFIDNGIGIHANEIENIFQPFFRASNAKTIAGHGLGLSLTERIIKVHNGQISIHSEIDKGTRVRIGIPYLKEEGA